MNNKRANIWSIILFLLLSVPAFAQPISVDEAQRRARQFLVSKGHSESADVLAAMPSRTRSQAADSPYYVFNIGEEQGFVIVSGDDRTPEVLGYSERGAFDIDRLPPSFEEMLQGYADQIKYLQENNVQVQKKATTRSSIKPIAPMIQTKWSQNSPYNDDLPVYANQRCLTGCVATAMAQIMYYHQHPKDLTAEIPGYTTNSWGIEVDGLPATTFDWAHMTPTYSSLSTAEENSAVAHLMKYCATALQADFGIESTSAIFMGDPLFQYFGYSENVKRMSRNDYEDKVWNNKLYFELSNGRPVMYSGRGSDGHAFILDGCDDEGRYSVNWGWGGLNDGFFFLDAMIAAEDRYYSFGQMAIIGISPYDVETYSPVIIDGLCYYFDANDHTAIVTKPDDFLPYVEDIRIPESIEYEGAVYQVTGIGYKAFIYNYSRSVTIPSSVTTIGNGAFEYSGIQTINLSEGLVSIGDYAFGNCTELTSINIPSTVTSIGESAFAGCSRVESFGVAPGNPKYDSRNNCNALIESDTNTLIYGCNSTVVPDGVIAIGYYAFGGCSGLTSLVLPDGLQTIGLSAFNGCSNLTEVYIPKSVTLIETNPFSGCANLRSITVEEGNPVYDSRNDCNAIIETESSTLHTGCVNTVIPEDIQTIGLCAFQGCVNLTDITIPDGVKTIDSNAFDDCTGLTSVVLPNSVSTLETFCFADCSNLESIRLSKNISRTSTWCFIWCTNLKDVYCASINVPEIDQDTFDDCPIGEATLHVPEYSLEAYKSTAPWSYFGHFETLPADEVSIQAPLRPHDPIVIRQFDLNGQRVTSPRKGIYIRNGQKVLVK